MNEQYTVEEDASLLPAPSRNVSEAAHQWDSRRGEGIRCPLKPLICYMSW